MNCRNYEFVLVGKEEGDRSTAETNHIKVRANTLQEAISSAYIRLHNLRSEDGKTWRIVKATDITHFDKAKMF